MKLENTRLEGELMSKTNFGEALESQLSEMKENMRKLLEEKEEHDAACEQKLGEAAYLQKLVEDSDRAIQELRGQLASSTNELQAACEENARLQKSDPGLSTAEETARLRVECDQYKLQVENLSQRLELAEGQSQLRTVAGNVQ